MTTGPFTVHTTTEQVGSFGTHTEARMFVFHRGGEHRYEVRDGSGTVLSYRPPFRTKADIIDPESQLSVMRKAKCERRDDAGSWKFWQSDGW